MNINNPEESLEIIYSQLSKSEIFKGYRPKDLTAIGLLSAGFTAVQPILPLPGDYLSQWMGFGLLVVCYVFGRILLSYTGLETRIEKQKVKTIIIQFFPSLLAGAVLFIFLKDNPDLAPVLPALLCFLFGLGIAAMIPHLTRVLIFVILIYFTGGIFLLAYSGSEQLVIYRLFGAVFSIGHLCSAFILKWYVNEE